MERSIMALHHLARRRLKLRQLEILLAVADTGSMAKAATRLAISQPAISRAIADAENTLGVALFDRSTQGVEPTRYGHALVKRGIAAFDEIDKGVKELEFLADPNAGDVRIGSGAGLSDGIVLAAINRLSRQYPRVVFHVAIHNGIALYDQLRERNVELGFVRVSGLGREEDEDIHLEMLFEEPLIVVAGAENPWARRRKIRLSEHGQRALDLAAARQLFQFAHYRGFSCERPQASAPSGLYLCLQHADQSGGDLTLSRRRPCRHHELPRQVSVDQDAPRRASHNAPTGRHRHA
jgi:DNA-binding transcriptional LysR family regulator